MTLRATKSLQSSGEENQKIKSGKYLELNIDNFLWMMEAALDEQTYQGAAFNQVQSVKAVDDADRKVLHVRYSSPGLAEAVRIRHHNTIAHKVYHFWDYIQDVVFMGPEQDERKSNIEFLSHPETARNPNNSKEVNRSYTTQAMLDALLVGCPKAIFEKVFKKLSLASMSMDKKLAIVSCPSDAVYKDCNSPRNKKYLLETLTDLWPHFENVVFIKNDTKISKATSDFTVTNIHKGKNVSLYKDFMAMPFLAQSSRQRNPIEHISKDKTAKIRIEPDNNYGFACYKDFNVLIVLFSNLYNQRLSENLKKTSLKIREKYAGALDFSVSTTELLKSLGKSQSGKNYKWLEDAIIRLKTTKIFERNSDPNNPDDKQGSLQMHSWIYDASISKNMVNIKLSEWTFRVLSTKKPIWTDANFWLNLSPAEMALYEIALTSCPEIPEDGETHSIHNVSTVYKNSGFSIEIRKFRSQIKQILSGEVAGKKNAKQFKNHTIQYIDKEETKTKKEDQIAFYYKPGSDEAIKKLDKMKNKS